MTTTGRAALFFGPGKPMEITELPVPDPEAGAVVVRVTRANICGSDLHICAGTATWVPWDVTTGGSSATR